jgi:uncharacterized membrane protein YqaE (UPF0057 family)
MKILKLVSAILLPPLAVFLTMGISPAFLINLGLTFLGWVPGVIHALWVIQKSYEPVDRSGVQ